MLVSLAFAEEAEKKILCEPIETAFWDFIGYLKTCRMWGASRAINSTGFKILPKNEAVGAVNFNTNEKIEFLPVDVHESFPNLKVYAASMNKFMFWKLQASDRFFLDQCSFLTISKENFESLTQLRVLNLELNQIEKISSDTFEDLISLQYLNLSKFDCFNFFFSFSLSFRITANPHFDGEEICVKKFVKKTIFWGSFSYYLHTTTWKSKKS